MLVLKMCGTRVEFDALMRAAGGMESIVGSGGRIHEYPQDEGAA
jgi:hypothetical protein